MGNPAPFAAAELGLQDIPSTRFEGACATGSVAIRDAYMWVASGCYDVVLVAGTERVCNMGTPFATRTFAMGHDSYYEQFTGLTFPGVFAMMAHLYSKKYGIPLQKLKEMMALVSVKNHANALLNPKAHFHKKITVEDVLNSPMICDPLQLYDCCPFSDGAAAVVLASEEKAKKLTDTPVYIAGTGQSSAGPLFRQKDITITQARITSSKMAYKQAKVEPKDIDVVELHDCFTIAEIVATEALGFFNFGEGGKAVEEGLTQIGGKIPVNPSGGLKAKGHPIGATGIAQAVEIVEQLRGEAGKRQVDAEIGMTDTLGGDLATVCNVIYRNDRMEYVLPYKKWAESLKNGKLLGLRCKQCKSITTPPQAVCSCGSKDFDVIELSGKGKIVTFTVVRVPPEGFEPSVVALAELEEGCMVVGNVLCDIDEADMNLIGRDVEVGWKDVKGDRFSSGDRVVLTFRIK